MRDLGILAGHQDPRSKKKTGAASGFWRVSTVFVFFFLQGF